MINLKLDIHCPCGHNFKIDPVGVQPDTDVICPSCGTVDHVSQSTIDEVEQQLMDALNEVYDDEDSYQAAIAFWYEAPDKERAKIVDDGF